MQMKIAQILKSARDFDIWGGLDPATARESTANSKAVTTQQKKTA
jgi:hypothetical protein